MNDQKSVATMMSTAQHERLLDEAAAAFVEQGISHASLDGLLEESEVPRTRFYAAYGSKENLVAAVLRFEERMLERLLIEPVVAKPAHLLADAAVDCVRAILLYQSVRPNGFRLLFGLGRAAQVSEVRSVARALIYEAFATKFSAWLEDDPRELVQRAQVAAAAVLTVGVSAAELAERGFVSGQDARRLATHTVRNIVDELSGTQGEFGGNRRDAC